MKQQSVLVPYLLCRIIKIIADRRQKDAVADQELAEYDLMFNEVLSFVVSVDAVDKDKSNSVLYNMLLPLHEFKDYENESDVVERLVNDEFSVIKYCSENSVKALYNSPNVLLLINKLFFKNYAAFRENTITSSPFLMCNISLLMSVFRIIITGYMIVASRYDIYASIMMFIVLVSVGLYELAQFERNSFDLSKYLAVWNIMDLAIVLFLALYFITFIMDMYCHETCPMKFIDTSRLFLCLSIVLQVFRLLQFLCLYKDLGLFVISVFAMIQNVWIFLPILVVISVGASFATEGILSSEFRSDKFTDYVGNGVLGNIDFDGSNWFSIILTVAYGTITSTLLLNLLVAKMSSTYDNVIEQSQGEWGALQVRFLVYILFKTEVCCHFKRLNCSSSIFTLEMLKISIIIKSLHLAILSTVAFCQLH